MCDGFIYRTKTTAERKVGSYCEEIRLLACIHGFTTHKFKHLHKGIPICDVETQPAFCLVPRHSRAGSGGGGGGGGGLTKKINLKTELNPCV